MGTFINLPQINSAVSFTGTNSTNGNRTNLIHTCASDEYAILRIYYSSTLAATIDINLGFSSLASGTSFNAADTIYWNQFTGNSISNVPTYRNLSSQSAPGEMIEILVGPGQSLYWGANVAASNVTLNAYGVKFKNA